uniref:Uncharacterized protein n=1 Tax=Sphaerodactylus townsendi TaxID=933632 RepID=A0ACB8EBX2_9SAUR
MSTGSKSLGGPDTYIWQVNSSLNSIQCHQNVARGEGVFSCTEANPISGASNSDAPELDTPVLYQVSEKGEKDLECTTGIQNLCVPRQKYRPSPSPPIDQ